MSSLLGHRRPAWLLAGMLAGAMVVAPTVTALSTSAPAAVQTRVASCQGLNFHAITTDTTFGYRNNNGTMLIRYDSGQADDPDGFFLCDPGLPNKAVVTKVQFTVFDGVELGEVRYCALYRAGLTASNADDASQLMAEVGTTGMAAQPGVVRRSDTSIANATIDNASWGCWLQCQINFPQGSSSNGVGIYGANVTYQISAANG